MDRDRSVPRLILDEDRLDDFPILAAYELTNSIIQINLEVRALYDLKLIDVQVLHVIMAAVAQKVARQMPQHASVRGSINIPMEKRGSISHRAIAEVLELPLETVRRSVARLIGLGLVEEVQRGKLVGTARVVERDGFNAAFKSIAKRWVSVTDKLLKHGIVKAM